MGRIHREADFDLMVGRRSIRNFQYHSRLLNELGKVLQGDVSKQLSFTICISAVKRIGKLPGSLF